MFDSNKRNYLKSNDNTNKIMTRVLIALLPIILFGWFRTGIMPFINQVAGVTIYDLFKPILLILIPVITCLIAEYIFIRFIFKKENYIEEIKKSYSFFPGLFLGLILPINTPLLIVVLGALFATIIGKMLYGGFSHNIFNPALLGRIFIIFCYSTVIVESGGYFTAVDTISSATPLTLLQNSSYQLATNFPYTLSNLFIGNYVGCLGETSVLLCLIAFIYLTVTKTIKFKIPLFYILTVFVVTTIIGISSGNPITYGLYQIMSGGLFFGAIFMATDPVTSPINSFGQVIYGICLGLLTVAFRFLTNYPEGVLTSILTMNMLVPIVDKISFNKQYNKDKIITIIVIIILSILIILPIINKLNYKETDQPNPNFKIESKEVNNNVTTYIAYNKGFSGNIKLKVVITGNKITEVLVIEQNESYFNLLEKDNYINKFITDITKVNEVDTVSGATVSSSSIKTLILKVIEDYKKNNDSIPVDKDEVVPPVIENKEIEIIDKQVKGRYTTYTIKKQGFMSMIEAKITFNYKNFSNIEIISHEESYFKLLDKASFINNLNKRKTLYQKVDTVSKATHTSQAIKDMILYAENDIKGIKQ